VTPGRRPPAEKQLSQGLLTDSVGFMAQTDFGLWSHHKRCGYIWEAQSEHQRISVANRIAAVRFEKQQLDQLEAQLVRELRADGWSWAMVGQILGVSKQAAWSRFEDADNVHSDNWPID